MEFNDFLSIGALLFFGPVFLAFYFLGKQWKKQTKPERWLFFVTYAVTVAILAIYVGQCAEIRGDMMNVLPMNVFETMYDEMYRVSEMFTQLWSARYLLVFVFSIVFILHTYGMDKKFALGIMTGFVLTYFAFYAKAVVDLQPFAIVRDGAMLTLTVMIGLIVAAFSLHFFSDASKCHAQGRHIYWMCIGFAVVVSLLSTPWMEGWVWLLVSIIPLVCMGWLLALPFLNNEQRSVPDEQAV